MKLHSGSFSLTEMGSRATCFLIHGGAGPADPKGSAAANAREGLRQVIADFNIAAPCSPFLPDSRFNTNAERGTLQLVRLLEKHPLFNAGFGASLQSDGVARVSSSFMESVRQHHSAVINVTDVLHPSELAFYLQSRSASSVLDASGAHYLARELLVPKANLISLERFEKWVERKRDELKNIAPPDGTGTVGCVSVDLDGQLAASTSTGGIGNESVGRVGDTPTIAGNICTQKVAISCTGYGEQIVDCAFAARVATRIDDGLSLANAFERSMNEALARGLSFAAISLCYDKEARRVDWVAGSTANYFVWAASVPTGIIDFSQFQN